MSLLHFAHTIPQAQIMQTWQARAYAYYASALKISRPTIFQESDVAYCELYKVPFSLIYGTSSPPWSLQSFRVGDIYTLYMCKFKLRMLR